MAGRMVAPASLAARMFSIVGSESGVFYCLDAESGKFGMCAMASKTPVKSNYPTQVREPRAAITNHDNGFKICDRIKFKIGTKRMLLLKEVLLNKLEVSSHWTIRI